MKTAKNIGKVHKVEFFGAGSRLHNTMMEIGASLDDALVAAESIESKVDNYLDDYKAMVGDSGYDAKQREIFAAYKIANRALRSLQGTIKEFDRARKEFRKADR